MIRSRLSVRWAAVLALVLSLAHEPAVAQMRSCPGQPIGVPDTTARSGGAMWTPPLDRAVELNAVNVRLEEALDRIAAAAAVRLSYSREVVPLDRHVCVERRTVPVGEALRELLGGTGLQVVVAGIDLVVLAPSRSEDSAWPAGLTRPAVAVLDRVVVTGSETGGLQRELTVALDVVSGSELARQEVRRLSQLFGGEVAGLWVSAQAPSSLVARYASIRGASSYSVTYPKIYIDGVEVANPLLVAHISPESVDRVEVIRGPQGAALYGSDAISGVVQITTKQGGAPPGTPRVQLRSGAGVSESRFASGVPLVHEHGATMRGGSGTASLILDLAAGGTGEYIPGGQARQVNALAAARSVRSRGILHGVARLATVRAGLPGLPVLAEHGIPVAQRRPNVADEQSLTHVTAGVGAHLALHPRWTHTLLLGADGYRLSALAHPPLPLISATDSALQAARGAAGRASLRYSSVARLVSREIFATSVTLGAEHSALKQERPTGDGAWPVQRNTGTFAQVNLALRDALFVTGGLRLEHNDTFGAARRLATLPMLGSALVIGKPRGATLKLRAAYGKGIRPPRRSASEALSIGSHQQLPNPELGPEAQSGVEGGAELYVGGLLSLQVTRFDQRVSGLIQPVLIAIVTSDSSSYKQFQQQNVGVIANRGWELQGALGVGAVSLSGNLALTDSRVRTLARGYGGELRPGDRILEVPTLAGGITASVSGARTFASVALSGAADWINYDRLALYRVAANQEAFRPPPRNYWREYAGVTRLRATVSREVRRGLTLAMTGENLLDVQLGEPDNVAVVPGRTATLGLRLAF